MISDTNTSLNKSTIIQNNCRTTTKRGNIQHTLFYHLSTLYNDSNNQHIHLETVFTSAALTRISWTRVFFFCWHPAWETRVNVEWAFIPVLRCIMGNGRNQSVFLFVFFYFILFFLIKRFDNAEIFINVC